MDYAGIAALIGAVVAAVAGVYKWLKSEVRNDILGEDAIRTVSKLESELVTVRGDLKACRDDLATTRGQLDTERAEVRRLSQELESCLRARATGGSA